MQYLVFVSLETTRKSGLKSTGWTRLTVERTWSFYSCFYCFRRRIKNVLQITYWRLLSFFYCRNKIFASEDMACRTYIPTLMKHKHISSLRSFSDEIPRRLHTHFSAIRTGFRLPRRIILIRHGESLGNVDDTSYASIPDWKIPLTRRGERQAAHAGEDLHKLIKGESLFTYCRFVWWENEVKAVVRILCANHFPPFSST